MNNYKKALDTQKQVNEAVDAIFDRFQNEIAYADMMETMANAQAQIMQLMELNSLMTISGQYDNIDTSSITDFIYDVSRAYRLLRPFAVIEGQVYGNEKRN
jgi:hypothetical protein